MWHTTLFLILSPFKLEAQPDKLLGIWYGDGLSAIQISEGFLSWYRHDLLHTSYYRIDSISFNQIHISAFEIETNEWRSPYTWFYDLSNKTLTLFYYNPLGDPVNLGIFYKNKPSSSKIEYLLYHVSVGSFLTPVYTISLDKKGRGEVIYYVENSHDSTMMEVQLDRKELIEMNRCLDNLDFGSKPVYLNMPTFCDNINYHFTFTTTTGLTHTIIAEERLIPLPLRNLKSFFDTWTSLHTQAVDWSAFRD